MRPDLPDERNLCKKTTCPKSVIRDVTRLSPIHKNMTRVYCYMSYTCVIFFMKNIDNFFVLKLFKRRLRYIEDSGTHGK